MWSYSNICIYMYHHLFRLNSLDSEGRGSSRRQKPKRRSREAFGREQSSWEWGSEVGLELTSHWGCCSGHLFASLNPKSENCKQRVAEREECDYRDLSWKLWSLITLRFHWMKCNQKPYPLSDSRSFISLAYLELGFNRFWVSTWSGPWYVWGAYLRVGSLFIWVHKKSLGFSKREIVKGLCTKITYFWVFF